MPKVIPFGWQLSHKPFFYFIIVIDIVCKSGNLLMPILASISLLSFLCKRTFRLPILKFYAALRTAVAVLCLGVYVFVVGFWFIKQRQTDYDFGDDFGAGVLVFTVLFVVLCWDLYMSFNLSKMIASFDEHIFLESKNEIMIKTKLCAFEQ